MSLEVKVVSGSQNSKYLLNAVIVTGAGSAVPMIGGGRCTVAANGTTSAGTGACVVAVEVSNSGTAWVTAGTITLTLGTTSVCDGFALDAPWTYIRGNVTSISGTNATVSVIISV